MIKPKLSLTKIAPYQNGNHSQKLFDLGQRVVKLDSNESTVTPSPRVVLALNDFIQSSFINWYPDVNSSDLIDKLVNYTTLKGDYLQTFNGSDHALETICHTYINPGDLVSIIAPSYDHFRLYAESNGARLEFIYTPDPFLADDAYLLNNIPTESKIIYLVNPNNPTGVLYTESAIRQLLLTFKSSLIIVDEAYFEFAKKTVIKLVEEFSNLIVTRSFSKAFGLAGLRMGYIACSPKLMSAINKIRVGKHVNSLAQIAATASLEDIEFIERYIAEIATAKEWILNKMDSLGIPTVSTPANFILIKVGNPDALVSYLADQNIFVRNRNSVKGLEGYIRISIGHQLLMERFWRAFREAPVELINSQQRLLKAE